MGKPTGTHEIDTESQSGISGVSVGGLVLFIMAVLLPASWPTMKTFSPILMAGRLEAGKNVIRKHVFLRLKNINNTVDLYYSLDEIKWNKIENSLEVSGMHHNVPGEFMSLHIGLFQWGRKGNV